MTRAPIFAALVAAWLSGAVVPPGVVRELKPPAPFHSEFTLKDGTPVRLGFSRAVTSSDVLAGETVSLYAMDDVRVGDALVIPKFSPAQATVMLARPKQKIGLSGRLQLRFDSVRLADGEQVPLRLTQSLEVGTDKGIVVGTMASLATDAFPVTLIMISKTGKDVEIARGDDVTAYVNQDIVLDSAKFANAVAITAPSGSTADPARGASQTQEKLEQLACGPDDTEHHVWKAPEPSPAIVPDGQSLFYVVRPAILGDEVQTNFYVDGKWTGVNLAGSYFHFVLAPGTHYFCSKMGKGRTLLSLVAEPGETYYIQQKFPGAMSMELEVLNETEGKRAITKCDRGLQKHSPAD